MPSIEFTHKSASCFVEVWGDGVGHLVSLTSTDPQQGHATELMDQVMEWADREGLPLQLVAQAFGPKPWIPRDILEGFYERFGFIRQESDPSIIRMLRPSRDLHVS